MLDQYFSVFVNMSVCIRSYPRVVRA